MSVANFRASLALVLAHEGGYVNNPKDHGGETNKGITKAVYDAYRKLHGQPIQSVKLIENEEVEDIYSKQYWKLVRGDSLPVGLDYAVFDFAVNSGIARANKYLQLSVGVTADGILGNETLAAVYAATKVSSYDLIATYCNSRLAFLKSLDTFSTFGKGWTRRVMGDQPGAQDNDNGVIDYAIVMAGHAQKLETMPQPAVGKAFTDSDYMPTAPIAYLDLVKTRWAA